MTRPPTTTAHHPATATGDTDRAGAHPRPLAAAPDPARQALHDINNALATIAMHADLLLDEAGVSQSTRQHVEAMIAAVDRGSAVARHVLRQGPGNFGRAGPDRGTEDR